MATSVYEVVEVELLDGSTISMKPLKISLLRDFMKEFQKISDPKIAEDNIKSMDLLLSCATIAMKQYSPELATKEQLEEIMDIPTERELKDLTKQVLDNNFQFQRASDVQFNSRKNNPIPLFPGEKESPIKHIVFISKENRTYDEIFGQITIKQYFYNFNDKAINDFIIKNKV